MASEKHEDSGLDFSEVSVLANTDYTPDPWYKRFGEGLLGGIISLGLWLLGFLLDIIKALWTILSGIFVYGWRIIKGIGHFFRTKARQWNEMDGAGKASFFVQGVGNIKNGQPFDGLIFMGVEIAFVAFMATIGWQNIANLINLGGGTRESHTRLINGFITIVASIGYIIVWVKGVQSAYDCHQIVHGLEFSNARKNQIKVLENLEEYKGLIKVELPDGTLKARSASQIYKVARTEYGYSKLEARYLSYVPFGRLEKEAPYNPLAELCNKVDGFFGAMAVVCASKKFSHFHSAFLKATFKKETRLYGYENIYNHFAGGLVAWHHTYDKYNIYMSEVRDTKAEISAFSRPEDILAACFAEDEVSKRNGIAPLPHDIEVTSDILAEAKKAVEDAKKYVAECKLDVKIAKKNATTDNEAMLATQALGRAQSVLLTAQGRYKYLKSGGKLSAKDVLSRIVGLFELDLPVAKTVAKYAAKALKEADPIAYLQEICQNREDHLALIKSKYRDDRLAEVAALKDVYNDYATYRPIYDMGEKSFVNALVGNGISKAAAKVAFKEYGLAISHNGDVEEEVKNRLAIKAARTEEYEAHVEATPYLGRPLRFKKTIKQYGDEKFAITVLALPTIGAFLTCILPLLTSISIAFTAWGRNNTNYKFGWSMEGFAKVLGLAGAGDFSKTFATLLTWTIIWAFFATFTNYIFGIVLALLINKKGIKAKGFWRTIFVVTIAVPQFITLLCMNLLLSNNGPINNWFREIGVGTVPFLAKPTTNPAFDIATGDYFFPKMMIIVVNMWIGIPYTMLSTSGILMNIPEDLYESARIDGATPWTQFWKITMPYILFVTGPKLLTDFIGNINNFNVIYFLTGGGPTTADYLGSSDAGHTDLLITWLFKITNDKYDYNVASVIGIMVFLICSFFSIVMYGRMGSVKNEEAFQ